MTAIAGGLLVAPLAAEAQPADRIARIGYLAVSLAANPASHDAFRQDCVTSDTSRAATS